MKAIITVGISCSGKTTWADEYVRNNVGWTIISRDNIRRLMLIDMGLQDPMDSGVNWKAWKWKLEKEVTDRWWYEVDRAQLSLKNIVIADTNLNNARRNDMMINLNKYGYRDIEVKRFDISIEEAWKRDAARQNGVGHDVIAKQWGQLIQDQRDCGLTSQYVPIRGTPEVIIVDVDGTLAKMNGRGPFEWHRVKEDSVNEHVADIVRATKHKVIVMSGRDGVCFEDTKVWLDENNIPYDMILMRNSGDTRKDTVIKKELFDIYVRHYHDVKMVIDDRPTVCRMWEDLGLNVLRVGNPYIEF